MRLLFENFEEKREIKYQRHLSMVIPNKFLPTLSKRSYEDLMDEMTARLGKFCIAAKLGGNEEVKIARSTHLERFLTGSLCFNDEYAKKLAQRWAKFFYRKYPDTDFAVVISHVRTTTIVTLPTALEKEKVEELVSKTKQYFQGRGHVAFFRPGSPQQFLLVSEAQGHIADNVAENFAAWWKKETKGSASIERVAVNYEITTSLRQFREEKWERLAAKESKAPQMKAKI